MEMGGPLYLTPEEGSYACHQKAEISECIKPILRGSCLIRFPLVSKCWLPAHTGYSQGPHNHYAKLAA